MHIKNWSFLTLTSEKFLTFVVDPLFIFKREKLYYIEIREETLNSFYHLIS